MKRWFRWWGIAAFAVLVVLVAVGWLLLADRIVKNALQSAGTRVVGAQVDIRKADLSLFPAGLTLIGLQVTNPQQPMQNAVEAERIAMSLDAPAMLQRKILIEELTLEGVRLNTPRKSSGAVKTASSRRDDAAGKKAAPSASESDLPGELLSGAFIVPDVGEILKNEKLQTLVLADTSSRIPPEVGPVWEERIKVAQTQGMQALVQPTLERWFTAPYRSAHPETMQRVGALIANTPVPGYVGCCRAIPKLNLTARLKEIKVPIQIIVGADDQGTPVAMSQAIHDNAPGSRLDILPQAAHLSNIEQPQAFDRALAEFLPT